MGLTMLELHGSYRLDDDQRFISEHNMQFKLIFRFDRTVELGSLSQVHACFLHT